MEDFMRDRQLVYGIDWLPPAAATHATNGTDRTVNFTLAACSFYDHVLDLYQFSP